MRPAWPAGYAEVLIAVLPTDLGGRALDLCTDDASHRIQLRFGVSGEILTVAVIDGPDEPVQPGDRAYATVYVVGDPAASVPFFKVGTRFEIIEGTQVVASGQVIREDHTDKTRRLKRDGAIRSAIVTFGGVALGATAGWTWAGPAGWAAAGALFFGGLCLPLAPCLLALRPVTAGLLTNASFALATFARGAYLYAEQGQTGADVLAAVLVTLVVAAESLLVSLPVGAARRRTQQKTSDLRR